MRDNTKNTGIGSGFLLPTGFHMEAYGTEKLVIEGCTGIQLYEPERIRLGIGRRSMLVVGDGLTIGSMFGATLLICGHIMSIEFI